MDEELSDTLAPALMPVGRWPSFSEAQEHALVVLAMNRECWIYPGGGDYALLAAEPDVPRIREEIELYEREQAEREVRVDPPVFPAGVELAMAWGVSLLAAYLWQLRDPSLADRFCNSSRALVEGGEWWRSFTALFLHADGGHLLSNLGIGGIFCVMAAQTAGAWRAWSLILAGGFLGNLVNAWLKYPADFQSLGASTATFAAVGVLTGMALCRAWRRHSFRELRALLVPVMTGLLVLGWYGSGGGGDPVEAARTDVAGHAAGWSAGMLLGFGAAKFERTEVKESA